jgi:hypothetical protein
MSIFLIEVVSTSIEETEFVRKKKELQQPILNAQYVI